MPTMPEVDPQKLKMASTYVWEKVIFPFIMVIVGIVIFQPVERWWTGPDKYIVYLVGNKNDTETQRIFRSIQSEAALTKLRFDGRDVEVEEEDDDGSITTAKQKASEIVGDPRTLLVIGHISSDITKEVLPEYMGAAPKVPVITTRETTPTLMENVNSCFDDKVYCPILSLSPTDDIQATDMFNFAQATGRHAFYIAQEDDPAHRQYTDYLVSQLKDRIRDTPGTSDLVTFQSILSQKSIDTSLEAIEKYKPSCIFYLGGAETLFRLEKALSDAVTKGQLDKVDRPIIVASDGAVCQMILRRPIDQQLYLTYQLSLEDYLGADSAYGVDAFAVVSRLVSQAGENPDFSGLGFRAYVRNVINMHRVIDARATLSKLMEANAINGTPYPGRGKRQYRYYARYKLFDGQFHVWQLNGGKVGEANANAGLSTVASLDR
jgi:hypothetical protein